MTSNKIKVFYSEQMVAANSGSFSPSAGKPKAVAIALLNSPDILPYIEFEAPKAASLGDLERAHDPKFVQDILQCKRANGFGNKDRAVAASLPFTSGSLISAAVAALDDGYAVSLSSGFHHAGYANATGFCTFNGLMVAAQHVLAKKLVRKVAVIDCDMHYGDGTENIIKKLNCSDSVFHLTLGRSFHRPSQAMDYLERLGRLHLEFQQSRPDLIIYQAGADLHIDDPLGGVLNTQEMIDRDSIVFQIARDLGIPICWNLAGGYKRDADGTIKPVVDLHINTFAAAVKIFELATKIKIQALNRAREIRNEYVISDWTHWDRSIDRACREFHSVYHVWPNILLASSATYQRIDIAANAKGERVARVGETGELELRAEIDFKSVSGFYGEGHNVEFCVEEGLLQDLIVLVFDNGDGDGAEGEWNDLGHLEAVAGS
jgi:acetoin utilization deacetylase AcuC-like enzyme